MKCGNALIRIRTQTRPKLDRLSIGWKRKLSSVVEIAIDEFVATHGYGPYDTSIPNHTPKAGAAAPRRRTGRFARS